MVSKTTLQFLTELGKNNNREWFAKHKPRYQEAYAEIKSLGNALSDKMSMHDEIEEVKTFRIYRDVRFSKNKLPYKTSLSGYLKRATKLRRGGYYFHIEPGNSFIGGGFWNPNPADLKRIRQEIAANPAELRAIIADKRFKKVFGELQGNEVKTAPRGYTVDDPAIDLLRKKQYLVYHPFTDKEVMAKNFVDKLDKNFQAMRPFFDYMSEVLTTDENGVPLY